MDIVPSFQMSSSFFENLPREYEKKTTASVIEKVLVFAKAWFCHCLSFSTNHTAWKKCVSQMTGFSRKIRYEVGVKRVLISEWHFLSLSKKIFDAVVKRGAELYFEKKISSGEETLESIKKKFQSKSNTLAKILNELNCKEIISAFGQDEFFAFMQKSQLKDQWNEFFEGFQVFFEFRVYEIQEICQQRFIELFSCEELKSPSVWQIFFAKRLYGIENSRLPSFAHDKLAQARKNLPKDFDNKVGIWKKSQSYIASSVDRKVVSIQKEVFGGLPIPLIRERFNQPADSSYLAELIESHSACKFTRLFQQCVDDREADVESLTYLSRVIELEIIAQCFTKYEGQVSDDDFLEAYKKWDLIAKDPVELEHLIEAQIAKANELGRAAAYTLVGEAAAG